MSYILDALRRADAERERGAVPSLQSQQHTILEDDAATERPRSLVWAVIALAVAVIALLAWNFLGGTAPPTRSPIEGSITPPVPAPLPTLQPPATAAPTAALPAVPTAPATPAPNPSTTAAPALQPTPSPPVPAAPPTTRAPPAAAAPPTARPPPGTAAAPTARTSADARTAPPAAASRGGGAPSAPTAEPRVYAQAELPEEIRRDLPKVVIGGSSYSSAAASRMVMINGQVFHEGDRLAADLVLERIRLKSAVFSFKGWRYEVMF